MPAPNYTLFEYRALKDPVTQEKGHALKKNNKHYAGRNGVIRLFGLHIAVSLDDLTLPDGGGEALNQYGATTTRDASWHVAIDTDTICVSLPDTYTAWVQGVSGFSFNSHGIGAEIATYSTDWRKKDDWRIYRFLRHLAAWAAPRVMKYKLPLKLVRDRNEVQRLINAGKPVGFSYHGDLDPSNRTDPGFISGRVDTFPIEMFFGLVREEINIFLYNHGNVYKDSRFKYAPDKFGSRSMGIFYFGEDVAQWQKNLNKAGFKTEIDLSFGPGCEKQTIAFQKKYKLEQDGWAGPATQKKMKEVLANMSEPTPPKPPANPSIPISRVGGKNRYETNDLLVKQIGKGGSKKAYIVNADEVNIDALMVPSDGVKFGTNGSNLPSITRKSLTAYKPTSVVVVGGSKAIADTVVSQLEVLFTP